MAMALVKLVAMMGSAAICCASSALDGALPTMFALEIRDCLILGGMVDLCFHGLTGHTACLKLLVSLTCVGEFNNFTCCDT